MSSSRPNRVALLIETSRSYPRAILGGIRRYLAEHGPWATYIGQHSAGTEVPGWLRSWDGDGILVQTFSKAMHDVLLETGVPAVELRSEQYHSARPFVGCDNGSVGELVARHFLERGYRHFAFLGLTSHRFFQERTRTYAAALARSGYACMELPQMETDQVRHYEPFQAALSDALLELPRPLAVMTANDQQAIYLLDACRRSELVVPDDVAIVGCENDETLCEFAVPTMSSVRFDGVGVGYDAAQLLDRLMHGGSPPEDPILRPPLEIVTRESSDDLAVRDPLVSRAARMIRSRLSETISAGELASRLNCSRSTLERRMKMALGRSPGEEIQRLRLRRVEELLRTTELTIESIASQVGIAQATYLQALFREKNGLTPGEYRRVYGEGGPGHGPIYS